MSDQGDNASSGIRVIPLSAEDVAVAAAAATANDDIKATAESRQFSEGLSASDLKKVAEASDHKRNEHFKDNFGRLQVIGMWAIGLGLLALAGVWALHMVLPTNWQWLDKEALSRIQGIITGGALVSLLTEQFRSRFRPPE